MSPEDSGGEKGDPIHLTHVEPGKLVLLSLFYKYRDLKFRDVRHRLGP
jgi:hypothetical protein